jgi:orotate phosphoribosyltransferase
MPSLDQDDVLGLFRRTGALLKGHFRLSSGLHSNGYLQSALVLSDPVLAGQLGAALAGRARDLGAELVLSPALGGLVIGHEVARALGVRAIFAERQDGRMTLRRGFSIAPGTRVLVVEDVVTTGVSTRETMAVVEASGGRVVGAASIIDRSGGRAELGGPYVALARIDLPTWDQTACPLCASGVPVVKPGSRPTPSAAS